MKRLLEIKSLRYCLHRGVDKCWHPDNKSNPCGKFPGNFFDKFPDDCPLPVADWIPVEEALPIIPEGDYSSDSVLVFDETYGVDRAWYKGLRNGKPDWYVGEEYRLWDVTHWRELPEPPKQEEKK